MQHTFDSVIFHSTQSLKCFKGQSSFVHSLLFFFFNQSPTVSSSFIQAVVVAVQVSVQADRPDRGLSDRVDQSVRLLHSSTVYNRV